MLKSISKQSGLLLHSVHIALSVGRSVCLLDISVSSAKPVEAWR